MKKKFTEVLAVVLAMATILSGCGGGGASNGESASSTPMGTTGVEETVEPNEPLPTEEPTEEPVVDPKTVITRSDSFTITRQDMGARNAFSDDGVAWLIVEDPETHHQYNAVVNTNGEIVYLSDPQDFGYGAKQANEISTTAFYNGLSAIYLYANFAIVNANGEEVYKNTDEDMLLCGGFEDGSFLLAKHETGFDHDYWELYVLDSDLNLRDTTIQLDDEPENENASELMLTEYIYVDLILQKFIIQRKVLAEKLMAHMKVRIVTISILVVLTVIMQLPRHLCLIQPCN